MTDAKSAGDACNFRIAERDAGWRIADPSCAWPAASPAARTRGHAAEAGPGFGSIVLRTRASQGAHAPVAVPLRGLRPRCRELVPELLGALAFSYLCTHFTRPPRTGAVYAPCPGVQVFTPRDTESLER